MPYGNIQRDLLEQNEIQQILTMANIEAVSAIDTSPDYGDAESIIGQCDWKKEIATKLIFGDENELSFEKGIMKSIERLQVDSLDLIFIHNWDDLCENQRSRAYDFLSKMKEIGLVKDFGISTYSLLEVKKILSSKVKNLCIQINMNILDQRVVELGIEKWRTKLLEKKITLWGRSIFLKGILLDPSNSNPFNNHPDLRNFWDFCRLREMEPYDVCLAFPRQLDFIDAMVIGISSKIEMYKIIQSINKSPVKLEMASFASCDSDLIDPRKWS